MPTNILSDKNEINKFLNHISLPVNQIHFNHILNFIIGFINCKSEKNLSNICKETNNYRHQSSLSRFLNNAPLLDELVNDTRIKNAIDFTLSKASENETGFLIIDDTLSKKDSSSEVEGLGFNFSHSEGKSVNSHCLTSSHFHMGKVSMPINFSLYLKEDYCQENDNEFKTKIEIGQELIEGFSENYKGQQSIYVLGDSWYTCKDTVEKSLAVGHDYIGRLAINRTINLNGVSSKISEHKEIKNIKEDELEFIQIDGHDYYTYRYEGSVGKKDSKIESVVVILCWEDEFSEDETPYCILCTDTDLDTESILKYYKKRWKIETSYYYIKNSLGLEDQQLHSLKAIIRFWRILYLAYNFLEIERVINLDNCTDDEQLRLSDIIKKLQEEFFKFLIDFIYQAGKDNIPIEQIYNTLNLDVKILHSSA